MLESASLEKVLPDAAQNSEAGDVSPCRSPSTPRHLRYRQPGGKAVTHTQGLSPLCPLCRAQITAWRCLGVRAHPPQQLVHVVNEECSRLESLMGTQGKNRGMNRATRAFATIWFKSFTQLNATFLSPCPPPLISCQFKRERTRAAPSLRLRPSLLPQQRQDIVPRQVHSHTHFHAFSRIGNISIDWTIQTLTCRSVFKCFPHTQN